MDFFSDEELEITELPEREEMLSLSVVLDAMGLGINLSGLGLNVSAGATR